MRLVPRVSLVVVVLAGTTWAPVEAQQQQRAQQGRPAAEQRMDGQDTALEDRVFVRLAERAYAGADFEIQEREGGAVSISGTVPSEEQRDRVLRVVRRTPGVAEVRDELRIDPSVARQRAAAPRVDDDELEQRIAQAIARAVPGAKAGQSWWFRGWRVEGPDNIWNFDVDVEQGDVTLEGDVPRDDIVRRAVEAALGVQGVRSVRSELELDRFFARYPYRGYGYGGGPYPMWARPGLHTMPGQVTSVDRQRGSVTVRTDQGQLSIPIPTPALQRIQRGDRVIVELGLREAGPPAASPRTGEPTDGAGRPVR